MLYDGQGRGAEAEALYRRSLSISETAFGEEHRQVGLILNNIGVLYIHQGRYAEAEQVLERSLRVREKSLGSEHPEVCNL